MVQPREMWGGSICTPWKVWTIRPHPHQKHTHTHTCTPDEPSHYNAGTEPRRGEPTLFGHVATALAKASHTQRIGFGMGAQCPVRAPPRARPHDARLASARGSPASLPQPNADALIFRVCFAVALSLSPCAAMPSLTCACHGGTREQPVLPIG